MADPQDAALGGAIRRRRKTVGIAQKEMAAKLGVVPAIYGRMELGNRTVKATELLVIANALGVSTDDLLRQVTPVTPEEQVERARARREAAYSALHDYGAAVIDAIDAIEVLNEYDEPIGAMIDEQKFVADAAELVEWLRDSQPTRRGLAASSKDAIAAVREAIDDVAASVGVSRAVGEPDDRAFE